MFLYQDWTSRRSFVRQSKWYELEIETVTKILYDIVLFTFKSRMDYYAGNETDGAGHVVVFVCLDNDSIG